MNLDMIPFNIGLLIPTKETFKGMIPVNALDIFEGATRNFHPNGLFSTDIFGKPGSEYRNRIFSYIDLKVPVFHPTIYRTICKLKHLYEEIIAGSSYAVWDDEIKDFVKSTPLEGRTGFNFFVEHFQDIVYDTRESTQRKFNVELMQKNINACMIDMFIVMPAGIRDMEIDETGKPSEDEINKLYRAVLGLSNLITETAVRLNIEVLDNNRYNLQVAINAIYDYISTLIDGKKKFILGKWATRSIFNGTRNVITSMNTDVTELDGQFTINSNNTVIGLYQFLKGALPIACHHIRNGFLSQVFMGANSPAVLVNKKTLRKELVHVDPNVFDDWMTDEGIEKVISRYGIEDLRHMYLEAGDHYLGLIYKGPDETYRVFQNIDDLPNVEMKQYVTPITFSELLYLAVCDIANTLPGLVTRFPIAGFGSIYPSITFLKTTVKPCILTELDANWEKTDHVVTNFPVIGDEFFNSMSVSVSHISRLVADNLVLSNNM